MWIDVDRDGEHCRFCRFLISHGNAVRADAEFMGDCGMWRAAKTAKAAKVATRSASGWQGICRFRSGYCHVGAEPTIAHIAVTPTLPPLPPPPLSRRCASSSRLDHET